MNDRFSLALVIMLVVGCHEPVQMTNEGPMPDSPRYIGMATMDDSRAIILDLHVRERGMTGLARFTYPPSHPQYQSVLEHVGGLAPGQHKPVKPWPP